LALSRLVGSAGRVIAFEPVLATAACVSRTRTDNNLAWLQVVPVGLGSATSVETKLLPLIRGMADGTIGRLGLMEPILISNFDDLAAGLLGESRRVDGVKIDVQGMELDVLLGMRQTLCAYRPKLIVEFHAGVNRAEILDLLQDCGYRKDGTPVEGCEDARVPAYADDRSYAFFPEAANDHTRLPPAVSRSAS
jgi:FkbM family methyltransferase